jgi:hypothetical protein
LKKIVTLFVFISSAFVCEGQVSDDFSDGDYTNNPAWTPDNPANWTVVSGQLRSNSSTASSSFYITTPSAKATQAQWEVYVLLQFNTSSANLVDIYLTSEQANLNSATNNGYFVRIGGTPDEISLYKMTNGVAALLINGTDGVTNRSNNPLRIKVVRDASNTWTLERDANGGTSYVLEGSVVDNTHTTSGYFGFRVLQSTSSFFNRHFFDDVYAGNIITDGEPPVLQTVQVLSSTELQLNFNEPLDLVSATTLGNYVVNNGVGNPAAAELLPDNKSVKLTFTNAFPNGVACSVSVSGVKDLVGNQITSTSSSFLFFQPQPVKAKDIIITEIMADPSPVVGLPEAEFVEIYNRSANPVDVTGWKFTDGSSTATLPSRILLPGEYWVVCSTSQTTVFSAFGNAMGVASFPTLNNTGESIMLRDAGNTTIDSLNYNLNWYKDVDKRDGGWTLERIDLNNLCAEEENWKASIDEKGGTPGKVNSVKANIPDVTSPVVVSVVASSASELLVTFNEKLDNDISAAQFSLTPMVPVAGFAFTSTTLKQIKITLSLNVEPNKTYQLSVSGIRDCSGNLIEPSTQSFYWFQPQPVFRHDIIITEVMADPTPVVGLPEAEFIEIHNRSANPVDVQGWKFSDGGTTATLPARIISPGEYWVICPATQASAFASFGNVIGVSNFPSLNNAGEPIWIRDAANQLIDSVNYLLSWYKDDQKKDGGWTLERIDLNNLCGEETNWTASVDGKGGTPGKVNSVNADKPDVTGPALVSVSAMNANELLLVFDERLSPDLQAAQVVIDPPVAINRIAFASLTLRQIKISTQQPLEANKNYTLAVSGIRDCNNNLMTPATQSFFLFQPQPVSKKDVIITEIMADPAPPVGLPEAEYVEIFNRSSNPINLAGWKLTDGGTTATLPSKIIMPGEYWIICPATSASAFSPTGNTLGVSNFPSLNNSGEAIWITDADTHLIDSVNYTIQWYKDNEKKDGGWSLELIDPNNPCGEEDNWTASVDGKGGTPGKVNSVNASKPDRTGPKLLSASAIGPNELLLNFDEKLEADLTQALFKITPAIDIVKVRFTGPSLRAIKFTLFQNLEARKLYTIEVLQLHDCNNNPVQTSYRSAAFALPEAAEPGDVLINEVLFNPRPGGVDFVEVVNVSSKYLNLKNWSLGNRVDGAFVNLRTITADNQILAPATYRVFTSNKETLLNYHLNALEQSIFVCTLPSMNDEAGSIALLSDTGTSLDYFLYDQKYHSRLLKDKEGVSLERITWTDDTNHSSNWKSANANAGFATPGFLNSNARPENFLDENAIRVEPEIFSPSVPGQDFAQINYKFDQSGFSANVKVIDHEGRVIRELAQSETLGFEGFFRWDGDRDDGNKARMGYYFVWFEVFDLNGQVKTYRHRVVVGR